MDDGSLRICAPPQLAAPLSDLFEELARARCARASRARDHPTGGKARFRRRSHMGDDRISSKVSSRDI
jgi:hypothetical protein